VRGGPVALVALLMGAVPLPVGGAVGAGERPAAAADGPPAGEPVDAELLRDLDILMSPDYARDRNVARRLRLIEQMRMLETQRMLEGPATSAPAAPPVSATREGK
jgi:hypothetical protein